jgi:hypothetical protein
VEGAILDPGAAPGGGEKVTFYKNDDVSVWGTLCASWVERNVRLGASSRTIEVDVVDFASVIREHGMPYYMKIDIEGSDMVCVEMLGRFRERPDYISIESDMTSFARIRREIDILADLGYDSFQTVEQSGIADSQIPPYPAREGGYVALRFEEGSSGLFGSELDGAWKSRREVLRQYRAIRLGYHLLGNDGVMDRWRFRGAGRLRRLTTHALTPFTGGTVPGWYDTHARQSHVDAREG